MSGFINTITQEQAMAIEQGSPEWLEIRRNYITATDAGTIMGLNPYETALQLYWKKVLGTETKKNSAMERGIRLEPAARDCFMSLTGEFVSPSFRVHVNYPDSTWMAASFDGINDSGVVVEIKCMGSINHALALQGVVPTQYKAQLQWQMDVAGVKQLYFMSYNPNDVEPCAIVKVDYDLTFVTEMKKKCLEFYKQLHARTAPDATDRDVVIREDKTWFMMEEELSRLMKESEAIEERKEELRNQMIDMCEGKPTKGYKLKVSPYMVKGNVDYSRIPALEGLNLDPWRKPASVRWRVDEVKGSLTPTECGVDQV